MKSRCFSIIALYCLLMVFLLDGSAYSDVIWTKSFNYSGKIIEEGTDYVILQMADGVKKIRRNKIEDITYSKNTVLPPDQKEKIQKAGESLDRVVQEQLKWRREHPKEYAKQLREEEKARKKEEAQEKARLKKLLDEEKKEEARLRKLLEKEIREDAAALKREMELENQARQKADEAIRKKKTAEEKPPEKVRLEKSRRKSSSDAAPGPTPGR
jgi:murein hydrolase activator